MLEPKVEKQADLIRISVGRDSRLSGKALESALIAGLASRGAKLTSFCLASTPAMFMSTVQEENSFDAGI